jgi:hypothetical protein
MASPYVRNNGAAGPRPQLPAFCRTRRPTTVMVTASSLACLRGLVLLGLAFQLSTLLLVIAGPVTPRLSPATVTNHFRLDPDPNSALNRPVTALPISDQ